MIFVVWIILCFVVAFAGKNKTIGYGGTFLISLLLSPLIGLIVALVSKEKVTKIIRCDGCRKEIKGEYIIIRPKGLQDKYDYCTEACRNEYHPRYMKEKGIEWTPPIKEVV
tara:strand:- start:37997 stop:38329 length:333 start_codon:yes stop_codon:yes gene_type:complete